MGFFPQSYASIKFSEVKYLTTVVLRWFSLPLPCFPWSQVVVEGPQACGDQAKGSWVQDAFSLVIFIWWQWFACWVELLVAIRCRNGFRECHSPPSHRLSWWEGSGPETCHHTTSPCGVPHSKGGQRGSKHVGPELVYRKFFHTGRLTRKNLERDFS